jgi:signal transduction histidine kinase
MTMLSDRLKNYIQKIAPAYPGIQIDVQEELQKNALLSSARGLHIFRILQEAVHNSVKHSGCSAIKIKLESTHQIRIRIEDNGKGIVESIIPGGDGIQNMKSRAKEINWQIRFENKSTGGCCITLSGEA